MAHRLEGARQKLIRASEHLKALRREIESFRWRHPYAITGKFDVQSREYVFYVRVLENPPERLSVIGGDCIHNFRSALDQIAHRLIDHSGASPTDKTQFPIVDKRGGFPAAQDPKVAGMDPDHLALIEVMQPYHGGNPEYSPHLKSAIGQLGEHPLSLLRNLSNQDKHRELHTVAAVSSVAGDVRALRDVAGLGAFSGAAGPLNDGAEIGRVAVQPAGPSPVVKMEEDLIPYVALPSALPYEEAIMQCERVAVAIFRTFVSVLGP